MEKNIIRNFCAADIDDLTALYNHYVLQTSTTFDLKPYTVEQRKDSWLTHYSVAGRYRLQVAERRGHIVGYATSSRFRVKAAYETSVETSIYLSPDCLRQGLGTQLYASLFSALAEEDIHRAYACVTLPNEPSLALHQKFGFEQVGLFREVGRKFGRYWDVSWLEKRL